ncbi:MAG: hypothetical protein KDA37_08960, partial [Planctomycetales bacterium]|nr:hypothetical protein [Planctomycetales bacterium]
MIAVGSGPALTSALRISAAVFVLFSLSAALTLAQQPYERPVTTAPQAKDIGGGYQVPAVQRTHPRSLAVHVLDVVLLTAGMAAVAWVSRRGRRRWVVTVVTLASLAYFGFYRQGCVCPIGATQNVAASMVDPSLAAPMVVLVFFLMPLAAA